MTHPFLAHGHRTVYYRERLRMKETARYTDEAGNQIVIESAHAALREVAPFPVRSCEGLGVHAVVDSAGTPGYVVRNNRAKDQLQRGTITIGEKRTEVYWPREEWGRDLYAVYDTVEEALMGAHHKATLEEEHARLQQMIGDAHAAAAVVTGDEEAPWPRQAYEAACEAAGLTPADDSVALSLAGPGGGVYSLPDYHREHVVWTRLAVRRARSIQDEQPRLEAAALARAEQVAGKGPYSREAYEAACEAAGAVPIDDGVLGGVVEVHYLGRYQPVMDVMAGIAVKEALGALPETAAALASRRTQGMEQELAERRANERTTLREQGHRFATDKQVRSIMRLLADRASSGEGGGFFMGPTDEGGVANLSPEDASAYITSLKGEY